MNSSEIPGVTALRPADVQQHLIAKGWTAREHRNNVLRFELAGASETIRVSLVQRTDFDDFAKRMGELVEVLAAVERRNILDVVDELSVPPGDLIAFRVESESIDSGTILLNDSFRLRSAQRNLVLSSAHSVIEPQPHFPRMSKVRALDFLAECREGQTSRGSYVMKLLVPIIPAVGGRTVEEPFGRLVVKRMVEALGEACGALRRGAHDSLLDRARQGISSNFLDALAGMRPPGERGALEIGVHWSSTRPVSGSPPHFRFDAGYFEPLAGVAAALRETTPSSGYEVEGYVAALKREANDPDVPGVVVLATTLDDVPGTSTVRVELPPEDYASAVEAHRSADRIRVIGTLLKRGRSWWLDRPTRFQRLPGEIGESDD